MTLKTGYINHYLCAINTATHIHFAMVFHGDWVVETLEGWIQAHWSWMSQASIPHHIVGLLIPSHE